MRHARRTLNGIFYVIRSGCAWNMLPQRVFGHKNTVHAAFIRWTRAGIFEKIHETFSSAFIEKNKPNYFAIDAALHRARHGGSGVGRNPTDRGKNGVKNTIVCTFDGTPLLALTSPANRHDIIPARLLQTKMEVLFKHSKEIKILAGDCAYDSADMYEWTRQQQNVVLFTKRKRKKAAKEDATNRGSADRWVVESAHSWINNFRGILTRYARHEFAYQAMLNFSAAAIVFKKLHS